MTERTEQKKTESAAPVWVIEERCKSCAKCVRACPAGTLEMAFLPTCIYGIMISIARPDFCVGCNKCENACPDFAIYVADKSCHTFPKLSKEARERQEKILANKCRSLPPEGEEK